MQLAKSKLRLPNSRGEKVKTGLAKGPKIILTFLLICGICILLALHQYHQILNPTVDRGNDDQIRNENSNDNRALDLGGAMTTSPYGRPLCTKRQLDLIKKQLPPIPCRKNRAMPWYGRCSFSIASRCPETPWLAKFLKTQQESTQFTSLFVGCNKAIDAVAALRMGSRDAQYNVESWKTILLQNNSAEFAKSSCSQFDKDYNPMSANDGNRPSYKEGPTIPAQLHCLEPVSSTFLELNRTNNELGWTETLVLHQAAVSSKPGEFRVPKHVRLGTENQGLNKLGCVNPKNCKSIPVYSLNQFIPQNVPSSSLIQYLSIDVEGFDFEVLKGSDQILKERVQYLEFEYNSKGPWEKQHLVDAIDLLDKQHFQCYWPGLHGHIWRITGCWLDHYKFHYWSNVACVNVDLAPSLSEDMERMFLETIELENVVYKAPKARRSDRKNDTSSIMY